MSYFIAETSMNLLAFDTSFDNCAISLLLETGQMLFDAERLERGHAELLIPKIEKILDQAGIEVQALDGIAVGVGPGSFTGVRVSVSAARGLALASQKPLVGIHSFEVYASIAQKEIQSRGKICVVLDARRRDLFYQIFDSEAVALGDPRIAMPDDLLQDIAGKTMTFVGNGVPRLEELPEGCALYPDGQEFIRALTSLASQRLQAGDQSRHCFPYYLAAPGITLPDSKVNKA